MKKKNVNSLDGFVPRRADDGLGEKRFQSETSQKSHSNSRMASRGNRMARPDLNKQRGQTTRKPLGKTDATHSLNSQDITDSLRSIDEEDGSVAHKSRSSKRKDKKRQNKPKKTGKKFWKKLLIFILVIFLIGGLFVAYKMFIAGNKIFDGGLMGIIKQEKLQQDANGRTNILIYGTSPIDHDGANLTDSIMVMSVNQETKEGFMVSLPRDLWVKYEKPCIVGSAGKLNAAYFCASNDGKDEEAGAQALEAQAEKILGLDIHYYTHVNWDVLTESVDAVGGIDVKIETDDPRGILDRNFDWECGYRCYYVKYDKDEVAHLDGKHALALSRARGAAGGYGLSGGNFDRERNQQKIIAALQQKALSAGTLTNIGKVTSLIDALGDNLRTDISTSEIRTALGLAANIQPDDLVSLSLVDKEHPLVTTSMISGQSVVIPTAGIFDYSEIHAYIRKHSVINEVSREGAQVAIYNATGQSGLAKETGSIMENVGYNVVYYGDAPSGDYNNIVIYQTKGDVENFTKTREALERRFDTKIKYGKPNFTVKETVDFVIVLGDVPKFVEKATKGSAASSY